MSNVLEFSVSEFSRAIKRTVEDAFGYVRIRGEITGFKKATSGHLYFTLKDENSVLSAVLFRGAASLVNFEIGDGLQVCASGRITTYEGRSNYQIIVEKLEIAGVGAILEMIEKRRQKLLGEGLFDQLHKKPIPFFPKIIGVITSPTGAVIEDIKHRIEARCPTHILLYPSLVQGDKAAAEIIGGIKFFNALKKNRPDLLIIARGGGSFEDLLCFNDETLVREVFKSEIPVISAVGHETDTTLVDFVADLRAPTPTAAAELATPLLTELKSQLRFFGEKLKFLPQSFFDQSSLRLKNLQRYLLDPRQVILQMESRLKKIQLNTRFALEQIGLRLNRAQLQPNKTIERIEAKLRSFVIGDRLILSRISAENQRLEYLFERINSKSKNHLKEDLTKLNSLGKMLATNHYREILKRGFALIKSSSGEPLLSIEKVRMEQEIIVEMSDGDTKFSKT
jgi:exodeoxyribonuclease VII large subunit